MAVRYIEQLQGELKAQNTIINQLRNRSTNQSSGHQPGHAHNSTLTTLKEDDIRDLKNLLELKDSELHETKIKHEASKNDLQQALKDKEKQIQGLHDILEGHIQDLAEKDAALAETTSELNNLESDVGKLILQLENRKQQLQLMSGQLQESVRESQLLKQRLRYTEAFTHPTYQIQAVEQHMLEIHELKPTLLETIRRTQDLYRHLQAAERASVKKDHSGRNSGSVCKSSFRSVIKALICCSDPAQPCLSSRAHVHGLHVLVPRENYDTLLEQMCEGRGLISRASELIQQRLQTHGRHHMQPVDQNLLRSLLYIINVTQTTLEEASKLLTSLSDVSKEQNHDRFCHHENLKMQNKLKKPKLEKSYKMNKMLSKAVKTLRRFKR
ncbi:myosin-9-like isoform X1 [Electrophorus electricus]|uniref:myosin-9-like isoform X1 n=1 Tax=Electrophorus electricus TaxID=8005 RepID=UPI0015D0C5A8|nr:myosin-9-like isoform X1 [Electrophorus electricus]